MRALLYRDRTEGEIRDIGIVRLADGAWSEPRALFEDNWKIEGCPVNGPAVAAHKDRVVAVWFTMAGNTPRVRLAFSTNGGQSFGLPVRIDDGNPLGRVDVVMRDDGGALVAWLEVAGERAQIRVRPVGKDATPGEALTVAESSPERASGFPVMTRAGGGAFIAWTDSGKTSTVRTARIEW